MAEKTSILHELYVFSEWKPEPEYLQKPDTKFPESLSDLWTWLKFYGTKKTLIDSITPHKIRRNKWLIALGDEGKVIAVITDNILEIRTKRSEYATIAARTTVPRDGYPHWRKLVWSPDCSFVVLAHGNGAISFYDLSAANLFNIPIDCTRPGGLECTDNAHAVCDIIFMPLRVKDAKWNWEVLVVTYDGKLRGYLVSQTDGFKLHHTFAAGGGVSAALYCEPHGTLYLAGVPRASHKDPLSAARAGLTAWRILNDEPFYKLSVVSDELEARLANERFQFYVPFLSSKNLDFIIRMAVSPDNSKLVCIHCTGDVSVWRLPLLKAEHRFKLIEQPEHALRSPLAPEAEGAKDPVLFYPADVNWWSNKEIIVSRFSGAVSVCDIEDMVNILGKKPEFFQGTPQVTCAHDGAFMALECETNVLPAKKSGSDESMEVVKVEDDVDDTMYDVTKELVKTILYAITDMEAFQPKPRKITVISRIYRLLGVKSTTPNDLYARKIESGKYESALALAQQYGLDSDLVFQQQWRTHPVSSPAIHRYLSKVSKKIWAVHQCVDRLPESLPAAKELLQFGLDLTKEKILEEINKELPEDEWKTTDTITLEDLNAYTSELLRCRHVMLFYKERLKLYEAILKCEKSTYVKDEYDRLRSNSIVQSAMEIASEGRIEALTCLWSHLTSIHTQMAVLDRLPETLSPLDYQHLLPTMAPKRVWLEKEDCVEPLPIEHEEDWCKKEIFRPIWNSNWSEETTPESESESFCEESLGDYISMWYEKRAREIVTRTGLVSHSLTLVTMGQLANEVKGIDEIMFNLQTLDVFLYDLNIEGLSVVQVEEMTPLQTCRRLMESSTPDTFVADLKQFVFPYLKRYEKLTKKRCKTLDGLTTYLENISEKDLSYILLVVKAWKELDLDMRALLELAERCIMAYSSTEQLDMACDLLDHLLRESSATNDGSVPRGTLVRRVGELERVVSGSGCLAWRRVPVPPRDLRRRALDPASAHNLLTRTARELAQGQKPTPQDWEALLADILELQTKLFDCVTQEQCYEIYASALLTSGDAASIRLAGAVLTCTAAERARRSVPYARSVDLVAGAAREYCNSASSLVDPALPLAKCCLTLIEDSNPEIEQELDLIDALQILHSFNLTILPIQVRLCEDKMTLIEQCLKSDPSAYLASHKLLKLAKMLRISPDDDQTREGRVLERVGEYALEAGSAGGGAAAAAARRLAALRYPAATLLYTVAQKAHAHADTDARRHLLAAAAAHTDPKNIEHVLRARLSLEVEGVQQATGTRPVPAACTSPPRCPSTDDEFADAITTPVIEKKDLIAPPLPEKKMPLFNYLLETFQSKFAASDDKALLSEEVDQSVHCQEFYRTLYPEHKVSNVYYCYDRFSVPDDMDAQTAVGQTMVKWYYIQNCLDGFGSTELESEVVQRCAEEVVYKDTALSVACLLHCARVYVAGRPPPALAAALYAALLAAAAALLRDSVYRARPRDLAKTALKSQTGTEEQMRLIRECIDKLSGMGEVARLKEMGIPVSGVLFNTDEDYRKEIIFRLARSVDKENAEMACQLASKYGVDPLEVWLQHAATQPARLAPAALPHAARRPHAHHRIRETLWPIISGDDHAALINYFTVLRELDDKTPFYGLTASEHIKLLKKVKSASSELDYKLLLEACGPSGSGGGTGAGGAGGAGGAAGAAGERWVKHAVAVMRADNAALVVKLARTLPHPLRAPAAPHALYTTWLTAHLLAVPGVPAPTTSNSFSSTNSQINAVSSKKWMQQYRQCASFFNKLGKEDLLKFVEGTCFSQESIQRIPPNTRNLMIMQAVDYCQQEQENDIRFNKNEMTWASVGQELMRWARFLENYHSDAVRAVLDASDLTEHCIWPELEMSHGEPEAALDSVSRLVLVGGVRAAALQSLVQCLHLPFDTLRVLEHTLDRCVHTMEDMQSLVTRLLQYHKENVRVSEEYIERVMAKANEFGLPPHKQIGLLSLSQRTKLPDDDDLLKIAQSTLDLFRTEWPGSEYAAELTDRKLMTEEGRRDAFMHFLGLSDTWQRKKALADILNCWPPTRIDSDNRSLHSEYLHGLLTDGADRLHTLPLIKLLLRRPVLVEEEVRWLAESVSGPGVCGALWLVLLSNYDHPADLIFSVALQHKEIFQNLELEDDLIKEMLDQDMFVKLVGSPLYASFVNYVINQETLGEEGSTYKVEWAAKELVKANYLAEAGHIQLLALGVPSALRGFSQAVLYCRKNTHK